MGYRDMTEQELAKIMKLLERYYKNFYAGMKKEEVLAAWYPLFRDDDPQAVERAVVEVVCTLRFPPTVADIKLQMAEDRLEDQPTSTEAFQMISAAVEKAYDRASAAEVYNELPPILRKLVVNPAQLISWHRTDENAFQTVIMSAIRSSYEVLAKREAKYYAMPAGVRKASGWRIEGAEAVSLPEPKRQRTLDEIYEDMDRQAQEYREKYLMPEMKDMKDKVDAFLAPLTENEVKMHEAKKRAEENRKLERMKP